MMTVRRYLTTVLLLTAVCSNVVECKLIDGDNRPSLNELRHFPGRDGPKDIAAEIQNEYPLFGISLLKDDSASIVKGIQKAKHDNPLDITIEIFHQWLLGKGRRPITWWALVECLRDTELNAAADYIEGALSREAHHIFEDSGISQRNKRKIEGLFSRLLTNVRTRLKEKQIYTEDLRFLINSFFLIEYIKKSSNVDESFDAITRNKLWDFWNYEALSNIVKKFAADDAEIASLMETYQQDLESYKATTKIIDHIAAVQEQPSEKEQLQRPARYDHQYYLTLTMKLNMRFNEHSLKYIDELWTEFANLYGLPSHVALLEHIHRGCVSIMWLIPSSLASEILDETPLSDDFYRMHEILRVEFDGKCIYQEENGHLEIHVNKEREKDQQFAMPNTEEPQGIVPILVAVVPGILLLVIGLEMVKKHRVTKTKDVEHQQPVEPTDIGEFSKLKVEEHDQSFNTPENSFQNKSGRKETYSEKCSCYNPETFDANDSFAVAFKKAWKAIEDEQIHTLERAIREIKESEGGSSALLDTCYLFEKNGVAYGMTLVALCGFHGRNKMIDLLLKEGADYHSSMLNVTARLAVDIRYLPPGFEFTNTPQKSRNSLTIDDLLLSSEDGEVLVKRAVRYMMEFLVTHFKDLASMAKLVPKEECPHPVQKSTVLPMKILMKDEKYTDDTIDILRQLVTDATLSGDAQVVVGDQLTCKNIRGAKKFAQPEINPLYQLKWAHENPGIKTENACQVHGPGTPIFQMMVHCLIKDECDKLSVSMLKNFIQKGANLSGKIATRHVSLDRSDSEGVNYGMLDLPLSMKRIDCAKVLVQAGVDLINGGSPEGEEFGVVPMFEEYCDHGTNEFICWAFKEYIPKHPEIDLKRIIQSIIRMKEKDKQSLYWQSVQRAPAHAILTSKHVKTIKRLIECAKDDFDGLDLLAEQSCTDKTALHVAAENGDVDSVRILLQLGAETRASDNSDMNPFMLAVEKGHLEVVKIMIKNDPGLMSQPMGSESTVIHWALEKGNRDRSTFFKGCFEEKPKDLLTTKDSQGNTIAHLVAASGNSEVFKILWSEEFATAIFSDKNLEQKTPIRLAVENEHINILKTFKACVDGGREATLPKWHRKLKREWWNKMVPCFFHASSCGLLDEVKYLVASGQKPNIRQDDKTPLLCAAEAGHDEIVAYLLQFKSVRTDLKKQQEVVDTNESPLLLATQIGHAKCVTLLLENGGNVLQRDLKDRNCLMIAIQNHHKATALAILSGKCGLKALKRDKNPTPLQLLVKEMPDLAEYALNKWIMHPELDGKDFVNSSTVTADPQLHYNFDILEEKSRKIHMSVGNHILEWMIEHKRLELLQHTLVEKFLYQKFWILTFPLLLLNVMFYLAFLIIINWFALVVPRPGPDSETCPENRTLFNANISVCLGQSGNDRIFLTVAAIILWSFSVVGLLVEVMQLKNRGWRYFKDSDSYFHCALYISNIIFIGFDNECWCSTPWQWQIGAFAVFFSWINFIIILRYMPFTDVPINMFLSICWTFLKFSFLPIMLIFAFGIPFYMVFVRTTSSSLEFGYLDAFMYPGRALAKVLAQVVGGFDYEGIFNQGALLYTPTTYILFITFVVTMPVLFNNFLTALTAGDPEEARKNAEFIKHKVRVEFILESERTSEIIKIVRYPMLAKLIQPCFENHIMEYFRNLLRKETPKVKDIKKRNNEIYNTVMGIDTVRSREELQEELSNFKQEIMAQSPAREGINKLKEDISNFKQEMLLLYKKSEEDLLGCQEVTVQRHAESTAMTAGYLRGLDVTGETSILVTNQAQTFHWIGYGLKLHIPQGTLPADLEKCQLLIKVGLSGQFKLPENSSLVSAVYWLDSEPQCKFSQPITVEMQHCVNPSHTSRLSFIRAKCSQEQLPYDFKTVEGGVFSSESAYGCVELYHFSLLGQVIDLIRPKVVYCASLYYLKKGVNQGEIHFVITKNLEPYTKVIQQNYRGAIVGPDLQIEFESDKISLPISLQGTTLKDGWKIFPLIRPVITKKEVDSFKPGCRIPSCQLKAEWTKESKPPQLNYPVTLEGAREPSNYFCIDIDWDSTQPATATTCRPALQELMDALYNEVADKWEPIGIYLHLPMATLNVIGANHKLDTYKCLTKMLEVWLKRENPLPTWSAIIQALKFLGEERLATALREKHCP